MTVPAEERFWAKVEPQSPGCWIWTAATDPLGYGVVSWEGKRQFAHRVAYKLLVGDPGPELDHLCKVHGCVNPDHLEPVTHAENCRRGPTAAMASQKWSAERSCPQGHLLAGDNLYLHFSEKWQRVNRQCRECRREGKRRRRAAGKRD